MKGIILLILVLLVGCKADVEYINQTVEVEVIKVCPENNCECSPPDCICNYEEADDSCTEELIKRNVRIDNLNKYLFQCLELNSTKTNEDLQEDLDDCIEDRDEYKEELEEIRDLVS